MEQHTEMVRQPSTAPDKYANVPVQRHRNDK